MGDWIYYVATMSMAEIGDRIAFAREIHANEALNELIQRRLNDNRAKKIAEYLLREEQRFFNALVVGVYGGEPCWHDFADISAEQPSDDLDIPPNAKNRFGFLSFTGEERLFALDGQHRLAGIRRALQKKSDLADEHVAVVFVGHHAGGDGLQRTRRLFTVLNKTAKPVLKGDIIALDEDDLMAICTRRLVRDCSYFNREQVAMRLVNSLSPNDQTSWTTITMIYDLLAILFSQIYPACIGKKKVPVSKLKEERASEDDIDRHYDFAVQYFEQLCRRFSDVREVLAGPTPAVAVKEHRHSEGGSVLYRPLGQKIFTQVVAVLCQDYTLEDSIKLISYLPTSLSEPPYSSVIWNPTKKTMANNAAASSLAKDIVLYMLMEETRLNEEKLRLRYAEYLGEPEDRVGLPKPVVA